MKRITLLLCLAALLGCDDDPVEAPIKDASLPTDAAPPSDGEARPDEGVIDPDEGITDPDARAPDAAVDAGRLALPILNEIVAVHAPGEEDWFEIYAPAAMDLAGCEVVDDDPSHAPLPLDGVRLEAGDLLQIYATDELVEGLSAPFKLGKSDALILSCDGQVADQHAWEDGGAPEGQSQCRVPDGAGAWGPCVPTPGLPNEAAEPPPEGTLFDQGRVVEVRVEMVEPDGWEQIKAAAMDEAYHPAYLTFDGYRLSGQVAIRTKGFSSLRAVWNDVSSDRYSFKIDVDRIADGQELFGKDKFVLNNGFNDPSYLREALSYEALAALGLPAPQWAFVDLYLDAEHMGLYLLVEVIDKSFLRERFDDDEGDLYKPERPAGDLRRLGEAYAPHYATAEIKTNEDTTDHAAFMALIEAINGEGDLEAALDVEQALRYLAANVALLNLDSYQGMGHNYYLYERGGRFNVLPWDYNLSFGRFTCGCQGPELIDLLIDEPVCGAMAARPLVPRLLGDQARMDRYHTLLIGALEGPLSEEALWPRIQALSALIRPYVEADERRFSTVELFEVAVAEEGPPNENLMTLTRLRAAAIRAQLSGEAPSTAEGAGNCGEGGPGEHHPCGDGVCGPVEQERPDLCPRDCQEEPPGGWCGDGVCDAYERAVSPCAEDCA